MSAGTPRPAPQPAREKPPNQPVCYDRPQPACEACLEAMWRGEVVHCSCLRIPLYYDSGSASLRC